MPRHTSRVEYTDAVVRVLLDFLEVKHTSIIIILAREQRLGKVSRMNVCERVVMRVPSTEAQIKTTNARSVLVYNHNLFVVRPKLHIVYRQRCQLTILFDLAIHTFASDVVGVAHACDVGMQILQSVLRVA